MENKEFTYQGKTLNGILMLVLNIIGFLAGVGLFIFACVSQEDWLTNGGNKYGSTDTSIVELIQHFVQEVKMGLGIPACV